ncbi:hydroxyisourate hydrolase [Nonomuraea sp. K274]|uniref:Hydroxyisourate hydrolase n=1 Tax=Nonomuraea cypriaca TaxID=1187855 RepID=A0A931F408_9ACTN|nr:hydroxyisourate hydrolase [Nonomuraea cypriaca]MBF8193190.1 hydroxyisourate hydrolase [Nonomuraea cypriaca]
MNISAQVLDGVYGRPASGLRVRLEHAVDGQWQDIGKAETDGEGNIGKWAESTLPRGLYRIVFDSDYYFSSLGIEAIYPEIVVVFRIREESDIYKILIMLSPSTYSTYFGTRT